MRSFVFLTGILSFVVIAASCSKPGPPPASVSGAEPPKPGDVVEVEIAKGVKMKFCWIPAGEAQLGSPKEERQQVLKLIKKEKEPDLLQVESEEVRGKYKTEGFWLGKFTVTQGEWSAVLDGKILRPELEGCNPSFFVPTNEWAQMKKAGIKDTSNFPVERMSWDDCQVWIKKLNESVTLPAALGKGKFCLPHEDEWEYAARGGKGNKQAFYFGNELNGKQANCNGGFPYGTTTKGDCKGRTTPVGSYEKVAPHPWGLCDMSGNVFQWCENKYDDKNDGHVIRGGAWNFEPVDCRAAVRGRGAFRDGDKGFRVCFRLD